MKETTPLRVLLIVFVASAISMSEEYVGNTVADFVVKISQRTK